MNGHGMYRVHRVTISDPLDTIVTLVAFSDVTPKQIEQRERFAKALGLPASLI